MARTRHGVRGLRGHRAAQADCTLRAAIESANYSPDVLDTITFEVGLGPIVVSSTLVVHGNTTIDGNGSSGAGATVIDGNDATKVFASTSFATDPTLTFRDLRIEDGGLTGGGNGAGIDTSFDTVIENSVVTSNTHLRRRWDRRRHLQRLR